MSLTRRCSSLCVVWQAAILTACGGTTTSVNVNPNVGTSVLQFHHDAQRDGLYVDAALTKTAAASLHMDMTFMAPVMGPVYGQPLFVDDGSPAQDLYIVATEQNYVYAFDGTGKVLWQRHLAAQVPLADLPCGSIDPLGITGTPIIDAASRTLYLDAMTSPDGGTTKKHLIYALSLADGSTRSGWPVDVNAAVSGFDSSVQNERGALALVNGTLYVPYGGHDGDCGAYHGWVVGVSTSDPTKVKGWSTRSGESGIWAPGGIASDGTSLYVATGNGNGGSTWMDSDAIIRLAAGPTFSQQPADYFAPTTWACLDAADADLGSSNPVAFDAPGATPAHLLFHLGKNQRAYLVDRDMLGGISEGVAHADVVNGQVFDAPIAYTTAQGTYVVFHGPASACPGGTSGNLMALRVTPTSPPTMTPAWCADEGGDASPIVTTTDGHSNTIVWGFGASGDNRLHGFDGDTGAVVFAGGGCNDAVNSSTHWITPIVAKGRILVGGNDRLYAFTTQ